MTSRHQHSMAYSSIYECGLSMLVIRPCLCASSSSITYRLRSHYFFSQRLVVLYCCVEPTAFCDRQEELLLCRLDLGCLHRDTGNGIRFHDESETGITLMECALHVRCHPPRSLRFCSQLVAVHHALVLPALLESHLPELVFKT